MNRAFYVGRLLVGMAGQTKAIRSGSDQLDAGYIFIVSDLVTTGAAHRDCRVNRFAFRLVLVTGNAGGRIGLGIEWNGMLDRAGRPRESDYEGEHSKNLESQYNFGLRVGMA